MYMVGWAAAGDGLAVNVFAEILANLVCLGAPILVALGIYVVRGRRRSRRFFGITEGRPPLSRSDCPICTSSRPAR